MLIHINPNRSKPTKYWRVRSVSRFVRICRFIPTRTLYFVQISTSDCHDNYDQTEYSLLQLVFWIWIVSINCWCRLWFILWNIETSFFRPSSLHCQFTSVQLWEFRMATDLRFQYIWMNVHLLRMYVLYLHCSNASNLFPEGGAEWGPKLYVWLKFNKIYIYIILRRAG